METKKESAVTKMVPYRAKQRGFGTFLQIDGKIRLYRVKPTPSGRH